MILSETVFLHGRPIGQILKQHEKGLVTFKPRDDQYENLAAMTFPDAVTAREKIIEAYRKENPR